MSKRLRAAGHPTLLHDGCGVGGSGGWRVCEETDVTIENPLVAWKSAFGGNHGKWLDTPGQVNDKLEDDDRGWHGVKKVSEHVHCHASCDEEPLRHDIAGKVRTKKLKHLEKSHNVLEGTGVAITKTHFERLQAVLDNTVKSRAKRAGVMLGSSIQSNQGATDVRKHRYKRTVRPRSDLCTPHGCRA